MTKLNIMGNETALVDEAGKPVDSDGNLINWPNRTGQLEIINGTRLLVKQLFIEIIIPAAVTPANQYNFADQPLLRNTALWGIESYTSSSMPISPLSKSPLVTDVMLGYMFLWMQTYSNSYNFFQNKWWGKFCTTNRQYTNGAGNLQQGPYSTNTEGLIGQHLNWPNGYIVFSDPTKITANTQFSIGMDIYYSLYDNWMADGLGASFGLR